MGHGTCSVLGCDYPAHARGHCSTHNWRLKKYGSTDKPIRQARPATDRFWEKVDASGDCWVWTASMAGGGYGWFMLTKGQSVPAHRWCYEHLVGPIPEGLDIDHLCRNRLCVNPDHLEPVTRAENMRRAPWDCAKQKAAKTHCPQGHEYAGENLVIDPNGARRCRICRATTRRRSAAGRQR